MRKHLLLFILFLLAADSSSAQVSGFQAYQDSLRQEFRDFLEGRDQNTVEIMGRSEFETYRSNVLAEFEEFKSEMLQKWGDFKERSKTEWVEYLDDGYARFEVDFERDEVVLEVLIESTENAPQIMQNLQDKVVEVINNRGTEMGFESVIAGGEAVMNEPVLRDQIDKNPGESDLSYVERMIEENRIGVTKVTGDDGRERGLLTINFSLAPNAIRVRAEKVQDYVYDYSYEFGLSPPLVFAIIHTESYFNPLAQSSANAYGLMQLVPSAGGADAYQAIHNNNQIPTPEYLFNPGNNVELGCAYVDILLNRYLGSVSNFLSKQYLAISAYNTGTSNVYRAYDSGGNMNRALARIDEMTPQENYEYLIENLPYQETREYLKTVVDRSQLYESWGDN